MQSYFQKVRVHNTCKSWSTVEMQDANQRSFLQLLKLAPQLKKKTPGYS
jgi:hypothetical protein